MTPTPTTSSDCLSDLIERLGKASGPQFALDCAIFETMLPDGEWLGSSIETWFGHGTGVYGCNTVDGVRHLDCLRAPNYTASIDAALTLVPEGWVRSVDATLPEAGIDVELYTDMRLLPAKGMHASEAIATCIAALRAHAAVKSNEESK